MYLLHYAFIIILESTLSIYEKIGIKLYVGLCWQ